MQDQRIERLAQLLLHHSVKLQRGESILIEAVDIPPELPVALLREVERIGAHPLINVRQTVLTRALLQTATEASMRLNARIGLTQMKQVQCYLGIRGGHNSAELSDVPRDRMKLYTALWQKPVHLEQRVKKTRWCILRYPLPAMAQEAQMSTEAFEQFFFDVCTLDYPRMQEVVKPLQTLMQQTDRVHIKGPGTDLRFSIKDMGIIPCYGTHNIPDGECFTAPLKTSVEGHITFNAPTIEHGVTHEKVCLRFKQGRIVEATSSNTKHLNEVLDTDRGARYIGEFSLAFNPHILQPMKDILFDEKIAGSFHFTPGQAYEEADNGNRSEVHWDLVCIQRPEFGGGEVWFDDVLVRRDGLFVPRELQGLNPAKLAGKKPSR